LTGLEFEELFLEQLRLVLFLLAMPVAYGCKDFGSWLGIATLLKEL
jgi:hypothetical protein